MSIACRRRFIIERSRDDNSQHFQNITKFQGGTNCRVLCAYPGVYTIRSELVSNVHIAVYAYQCGQHSVQVIRIFCGLLM